MEKEMTNTLLTDDPIDLDAAYYASHSSLQNGLAKKILCNHRLSQRAHILDVGCGDGRITAELATHVKKGTVIGLDASLNMIEFASKHFSKSKFPNLNFQLGMIEDVIFPKPFDFIISFSCFHWLKNPKKVIRQLTSSLTQNGEMLVLTYPKESPYRYLETVLNKYPEYQNLSANKRMLSTNEYKKLLLKNGLEILEFKEEKLFAFYNDQQEIQQYIKGWLNSYVPLPEHLHDSFLKDVGQAVIDDPSTKSGKKIKIPYTALIFKARK
jgi:trans-aconitate 2-methyltransferase